MRYCESAKRNVLDTKWPHFDGEMQLHRLILVYCLRCVCMVNKIWMYSKMDGEWESNSHGMDFRMVCTAGPS